MTPAHTEQEPAPAPAPSGADDAASVGTRSRDAAATRGQLLAAALTRFARDGYAATTVRDIAADAGVNVALINRYFTSKEGLFQACLSTVVDQLDRSDDPVTAERILQRMIGPLTGSMSDQQALMMLLLLRSSGDERADAIRRATLENFARSIADATGADAGVEPDERLVLRAQVVLATSLGIALLRSSTGLEPLSSATPDELGPPLRDVLAALLTAGP
ncbi:MAG: TetR family transcriptional regulator [Herbiconiux sp.]|nr:TetR family transcriptional regulator [Herbiconiux sp.]